MKIITSIHVANFNLLISYLKEGVRIIPFNDLRYNFNRLRTKYTDNYIFEKPLEELTTYRNQLFGINNSIVFQIQMNPLNTDSSEKKYHSDFKASQLALDYDYNDLYLFNDDFGIQELNIFRPNFPEKIKEIIPNSFEKIGNPVISNMYTKNRRIYLSLRGFGASTINNYSRESFNETIYRTEDAQDVYLLNNGSTLVVADGLEGLIFFEQNNPNPSRKVRLFNGDFPQQIKNYFGNILIKGKNGLYIYYPNTNKLRQIWEGSVGVMTSYYTYIFFSSKGQLNLISDSEDTISHFQLNNKDIVDIKLNKL